MLLGAERSYDLQYDYSSPWPSLTYANSCKGTQNFNFGKHLIQATPSDIKNFWLFLYAWEIIYPTPIVLIKLSILLFLYRIFHIPQFKLYASMIAITVGAWGAATVSQSARIYLYPTYDAPVEHFLSRYSLRYSPATPSTPTGTS